MMYQYGDLRVTEEYQIEVSLCTTRPKGSTPDGIVTVGDYTAQGKGVQELIAQAAGYLLKRLSTIYPTIHTKYTLNQPPFAL
jgi:hypothetical protein